MFPWNSMPNDINPDEVDDNPDFCRTSAGLLEFFEVSSSGLGPEGGWKDERIKAQAGRDVIPSAFRAYRIYIPLRILIAHFHPSDPIRHAPIFAYLGRQYNPVVSLYIVGMAAPSVYGISAIIHAGEKGLVRCVVNFEKGFPIEFQSYNKINYFHRPLEDGPAIPSSQLFTPIVAPTANAGEQKDFATLSPQFIRDMIVLAVFSRSTIQHTLGGRRVLTPQPKNLFVSGEPKMPISVEYASLFSSSKDLISDKQLSLPPNWYRSDMFAHTQQLIAIFHCAWGWGRTGTVIGGFLLINILFYMAKTGHLAYYEANFQNPHFAFGVCLSSGSGSITVMTTAAVAYAIRQQRADIFRNTQAMVFAVENANQVKCLEAIERIVIQHKGLLV